LCCGTPWTISAMQELLSTIDRQGIVTLLHNRTRSRLRSDHGSCPSWARSAPSQLPHQRRSSSGALDGAGLFAVLAGLSALAALLVLIAVPDQTPEQPRQSNAPAASLWAAYRDRRFWRIAPLSAVGVGTSWSLQGLWAAPWLRDVEGLERATVVQHLSGMAIAVCIAALFFGTVANRLRRMGVTTELTLAMTVVMSMTAQAALVTGCSIPSLVLWTVIAATPVTDRG
jgi:predicted MFS family arabinose efflux permease